MEHQTPLLPTALKWGVIISAGLIIFSIVTYVLGLSTNQWLGWLVYLFIIIGGFLSIRDYRGTNGMMSFGQGMGVGLLTGLVASFVGAFFSYMFFAFIAPEMIGEMMEMAEQQMVEAGNMTEEQIEEGLAISSRFMTPAMMAVMTIVGYMFFSFVASLIGALALKKEP